MGKDSVLGGNQWPNNSVGLIHMKKLPLKPYNTVHPSQFDSEAEFLFADTWLHYYPDLDLHTQHRFAHPKRHRFDFAHLPTKTAIEIQGGTWVQGMGHSSGTGVRRDMEKTQIAAAAGWVVLPIASDQVADPEKLAAIAEVIRQRENPLAGAVVHE